MAQEIAALPSVSESDLLESSVKREDSVNVSMHCPQRPYLELEIPSDCLEVRSILFSITSHDQGWSGEDSSLPPYEQSYTWFTVHVQKTGGQNDPRHETVQFNRRADPNFATHHVFWRPEGRHRQWLLSLRGGDIIQLYPMASYGGWVNFVGRAEIKIQYRRLDVEIAVPKPGAPFNSLEFYRSLEHDEIRVLEIHAGEFNDPIYCSMVHLKFSNDRHRDFEALSYCWGDAQEHSHIYMLDPDQHLPSPWREFTVTKAVTNAIRRLRSSDTKRVIWIDAVCINQNDDIERNQQVAIMWKVYSTATRVNVWLGEEYPGSTWAMMMMQELYNWRYKICPGAAECQCDHARHLWAVPEKGFEETPSAVKEIHRIYCETFQDFEAAKLSFFGAATTLLGNSWFRRVWVLQEVLLSDKVVVQCGSQTMPWSELVDVCDYMDKHMYQNHDFPQATLPQVWNSLRTARQTPDDPPEILDIFLQSLELESSDPRDKLWALLGFGKESNARVYPTIPIGIRPDYTKPVRQVFADFTRWHILEHRSLRVLSTIHGMPGRTWQSLHWPCRPPPSVSRPTWAVDNQGSIHWAKATLQARFKYRASADTQVDLELVRTYESAFVLSLKGFRVTTIERKGHWSIEQLGNAPRELATAFITIFDLGAEQDTWMCGIRNQFKGRRPDHNLNAHFQYHRLAHWACVPRPEPTLIEVDGLRGGPGRAQTIGIPSCIDPCLFVGKDGSFGLCPSAAKVGDLVVIFCGAEVPFLLREETGDEFQNCFQLVGECYLQGAMHGEFVQAQAGRQNSPECFALL